jgi:hypothetical protein
MSNDCPGGVWSPLIPRFADPNIRLQLPGVPDLTPIGNATLGFCARAIRETAGRIAAWRTRSEWDIGVGFRVLWEGCLGFMVVFTG